MFIKYTGTLDSACTITITPNTMSRVHFIENGTSGSQNIIISQGSGANVTIPPGDVKVVYLDGAGSGAAVVDAFASLNVVDLKVQDDLTVTDDAAIGGALTVTGIMKTDDTTNATSTTDGSLQTDGGLSVALDAVFGDDVMLLSDSAVLKFGADSDVTLTHAADTSLTCNLMMAATTFEPSADTAAGDNAAIGYTSAEGLILTGQGSSTDVTIKNDADATVASIATGTTIFTINDDIGVSGRAVGHVTTDNDGSFDLAVGNDFQCTPSGDFTLTFTNPAAGQSGNVFLINSGGHTVSAHASVAINATALTALATAGTYHIAYYCSAASGNNTIAVSASGALT